MPRPKKKISDKTDEEIIRELIPRKKVVDEIKKVAHEKDGEQDKK